MTFLVNKSSVRSDISVTAGEAGGYKEKRRKQNPVGMTRGGVANVRVVRDVRE